MSTYDSVSTKRLYSLAKLGIEALKTTKAGASTYRAQLIPLTTSYKAYVKGTLHSGRFRQRVRMTINYCAYSVKKEWEFSQEVPAKVSAFLGNWQRSVDKR